METKKETIGNRVRRTGGLMFDSIKVIITKWYGEEYSNKVERGVIWQTVGPSRAERRKHYKYKVNNKSIETSHPNMRKGLEKAKKLQLLRSLRLNTCKELRGSF